MMTRTLAFAALCGLQAAGCGFPSALACASDEDCENAWRCDPPTARCTLATEADVGVDAQVDARPAPLDAAPDAAVDSGPLAAFCAPLCPNPGPCEALVPIGDPSFELGDASWEFLAPASRVRIAEDLGRPAAGDSMAELRLDRAVAPDRAYCRADQFLATALPAGHYRLCFAWRIVSGLGNPCSDVPNVEQTALIHSHDPSDPRAEPKSEVLWSMDDAAGWCLTATVGDMFRALPWAEACVDFERAEPWLGPGLGFVTNHRGFLTVDNWHTFLVDEVRLQALDCLTWR